MLQGKAGGLVVGALRLEAVDYDPPRQRHHTRTRSCRRPRGGAAGRPRHRQGVRRRRRGSGASPPEEPISEGEHLLEVELRNINDRVLWKLKAPLHPATAWSSSPTGGPYAAKTRKASPSAWIGSSSWSPATACGSSPGASWGSGFLYSVIFERNQGQIRQPRPHLPRPSRLEPSARMTPRAARWSGRRARDPWTEPWGPLRGGLPAPQA